MPNLFIKLRDALLPQLSKHTRAFDLEFTIIETPRFVRFFSPYADAVITTAEVYRTACVVRTHARLYFSPGSRSTTFIAPSPEEFKRVSLAVLENDFPIAPTIDDEADIDDEVAAFSRACEEAQARSSREVAPPDVFVSAKESRILSCAERLRFRAEYSVAALVNSSECRFAETMEEYVAAMEAFTTKLETIDAWMQQLRRRHDEADAAEWEVVPAMPTLRERLEMMARRTGEEAVRATHLVRVDVDAAPPRVREQLGNDIAAWNKVCEMDERALAAEEAAAQTAQAATQ